EVGHPDITLFNLGGAAQRASRALDGARREFYAAYRQPEGRGRPGRRPVTVVAAAFGGAQQRGQQPESAAQVQYPPLSEQQSALEDHPIGRIRAELAGCKAMRE